MKEKKLFFVVVVLMWRMTIQNQIASKMADRFSNMCIYICVRVWWQAPFMCKTYRIASHMVHRIWSISHSVCELVLSLFYLTRFKVRAVHKMAFEMPAAIKWMNRFVIHSFFVRMSAYWWCLCHILNILIVQYMTVLSSFMFVRLLWHALIIFSFSRHIIVLSYIHYTYMSAYVCV